MRRFQAPILAGLLILIGSVLWWSPPDQRQSLFPHIRARQTISDRLFGGSSRVDLDSTRTDLRFVYALRPDWPHPWAGIKLVFRDTASGIDLQRWERLDIRARSTPTRAMRIQLLSDDLPPGRDRRDAEHPIYHVLEYIPDGSTTTFRWPTFSVPAWWNAQNSRADLRRLELLDRFRAIEFHSGDSPNGTDSATVEIQILDLVRPDPRFLWGGRVMLGSGLILLFLILLPIAKRHPPAEGPPASNLAPQPVTIDDPRSRQAAQLLKALGEGFADPELSLESFASQQGMSPRLVATLLKEATQLHFKGALNELRLSEAARLLKQSQANISEIAFAVGFQNLSHFGRAFREKYGASPSDFRAGKPSG
ncbi:MAG TPA: helix-turn-helix transcriptional regulator, partial [Fibrobacteria bacterium]|nr:helix-turn-helix transcriptional regulator [Fibrobacteria bacterium]